MGHRDFKIEKFMCKPVIIELKNGGTVRGRLIRVAWHYGVEDTSNPHIVVAFCKSNVKSIRLQPLED